MGYRKPHTAPRDGTLIMGLFEGHGGRTVSLVCSFEPPESEAPPALAPDWVHEAHRRRVARLQDDPVAFFRPAGDYPEVVGAGRMKGWRPLKRQRSNSVQSS